MDVRAPHKQAAIPGLGSSREHQQGVRIALGLHGPTEHTFFQKA